MITRIGYDIIKTIGKWLWKAIQNKKEEERRLDLFIALVSVSEQPPEKFVEIIIEKFIPYAFRKEKDYEKFRRNLANICFLIPRVIEDLGYIDFFPNLKKVKKELINKLKMYINLTFDELQEKFHNQIEEIGEIIKINDLNTLNKVNEKYKEIIKNNPEKIFVQEPSITNVKDYVSTVNNSVESFITVSGYQLDRYNIDHNYILHEITGMVGEYYSEQIPGWMLSADYANIAGAMGSVLTTHNTVHKIREHKPNKEDED